MDTSVGKGRYLCARKCPLRPYSKYKIGFKGYIALENIQNTLFYNDIKSKPKVFRT